MPREDKDAFIDVIYRLPNKIFQLWALEANKEIDQIIEFLKEQSGSYFVNQKEPTDIDILRALQGAAMSLLLELYNVSVFHSTKDNTLQYLSNFDYKSKDSYSLQHLMMLERREASRQFVATAIEMHDNKKGLLYLTLLRRIIQHAFVNMNSLDHPLRHQLESSFFRSKETQKRLMLERVRVAPDVNK